MFLWRKITTERWIESHSDQLDTISPERVAVIYRPRFKKILLEIACASRGEAKRLRARNGGEIRKLQQDWLANFARENERKPLRIGKRLVVFEDKKSRRDVPATETASLIIPSGAAFGTGDHPTTAMTLRLLEEATRNIKEDWSLADLGTGSGILSLAARRFGAGHVEAIDFDPLAIATAKGNARANEIRGIHFSVKDVKKWRPESKLDVVTANLFSQLLISLLPRVRQSLKADGCFIFSGVMRSEESAFMKAIRKCELRIRRIRRRGKWISCVGRAPATPA